LKRYQQIETSTMKRTKHAGGDLAIREKLPYREFFVEAGAVSTIPPGRRGSLRGRKTLPVIE
jgi:hypothetical protein